jgi:hypothetical protein
MDAAEQELREQRAALLQAVNAQDWETVESFIHPDFSAGAIMGLRLSRKFVVPFGKWAVKFMGGFREEVEIERIHMDGDRAELLVMRVDHGSILGVLPEKVDRRRYKETWEKVDGRWLFLHEDYHVKQGPLKPDERADLP